MNNLPSLENQTCRDKPSIIAVIGQRVELRKAGKEYKALCPFHSEKTPSFSVNEDKGIFFCHGCGKKGDVFDFIMQLDRVAFYEARAQLGIASTRPSPKAPDPVKDTAALIAHWADTQTDRANSMLRDIGQQARLARELHWTDEINRLAREWTVLETLADDLQNPACVIELWQQREAIDSLLVDTFEDNTPASFPPLTPEYWAMLSSHLPAAEVAVE